MEITKELLKQKFEEYNKLYFNNELKMCRFTYTYMRDMFGRYFFKKAWSIIWLYVKTSVFSFLLFYFAIDMWRLSTGDMRPLRKKGILVEVWFTPRRNTMTRPTNLLTDEPTLVSGLLTHTMSLSYSADQSSDSQGCGA